MKQEKEMMLLVNLLNSKSVKGFFRVPTPLCKKDYERLVQASDNSKDFHKLFNKLLEIGAFESVGKIEIKSGNKVESYIINKNPVIKLLKQNSCYKQMTTFFKEYILDLS